MGTDQLVLVNAPVEIRDRIKKACENVISEESPYSWDRAWEYRIRGYALYSSMFRPTR